MSMNFLSSRKNSIALARRKPIPRDGGGARLGALDALEVQSLEEVKGEIRRSGACGGLRGRRSGGMTI